MRMRYEKCAGLFVFKFVYERSRVCEFSHSCSIIFFPFSLAYPLLQEQSVSSGQLLLHNSLPFVFGTSILNEQSVWIFTTLACSNLLPSILVPKTTNKGEGISPSPCVPTLIIFEKHVPASRTCIFSSKSFCEIGFC